MTVEELIEQLRALPGAALVADVWIERVGEIVEVTYDNGSVAIRGDGSGEDEDAKAE